MLVACDLFSSSIKFQRIEKSAFKKIKKKLKKIKLLKISPEKKISANLKNVEIYWGNRITSNLINQMPNFLRVSIGLPEENLLFLEKLKLT